MENVKINDFVNEIAVSLDENYIQKVLQAYLEYKGLIDPKNAFDVFKFNSKLASPINTEDYKKLMDKLQNDYIEKGPVNKSLEEVLKVIPNKISLSSYELFKNTSLENSNYDHRAFKFSIAVTGSNLYAVLNILYDLAKKREYRFNFELPSLNLQKSGVVDKIVLYSEIANLENTLDFLNEALPLIESLVATPPAYKGIYKGIYSVETIMDNVNYSVDPSISEEVYIKDTNMHLVSTREKCWAEEVIGKTILEAIDETILYLSNQEKNIQLEGNILLDYFNNAKNKLIARRKIIKDIKGRYIVDIKTMLINTIQNRLQNKGVNLSNAFLSQEINELLKDFANIKVERTSVEINEHQTEQNPIAEGLPPIQIVTVGHPKYFVNEEFRITKKEQDEVDWKNLDVNMETEKKEEKQEEIVSQIEEEKEISEKKLNEAIEDAKEITPLEQENSKSEKPPVEQNIQENLSEPLKINHPVGEYSFIDGYPDKLEKIITDIKTGEKISLYDYFEREQLLELFSQDCLVSSSVANLQHMKAKDFINNYLLREVELKGAIDLKDYIKAYELKMEPAPIVQKEEEKVYKSNPIEAYDFIKGYPQKLNTSIIENRDKIVFKMNLYSYFEKEHLLDLFPRNSLVSGDNFTNLRAEDFINEHLLRYLEMYGAIDLNAYINGNHIVVKEQTTALPNETYLEQLESQKFNYTNQLSKYAYLFPENPKVLEDKILDFDGNSITFVEYFEREELLKFFPHGAILSNVNYEGPMTSEMFINNVLIPYLRVNGAVDFQEFIETQQWNVEMMADKKKGIFGRLFK